MQTDFMDAHDRHWEDAENLFQARRWANADHLYGLAAECGMKQLMLAFGMKYDISKDLPDDPDDRKHVNSLWERFESYRSGQPQGAGYALTATNPFADWDVKQRYANQSHFNQAHVAAHQTGAKVVYDLIQLARREGLLT
ncbi:MAG: SAM-dependent methyltransferase [Magnetococcales bacterium]|nr:SAM-dependent methyltransferase [Magnetococcales bacterium]